MKYGFQNSEAEVFISRWKRRNYVVNIILGYLCKITELKLSRWTVTLTLASRNSLLITWLIQDVHLYLLIGFTTAIKVVEDIDQAI